MTIQIWTIREEHIVFRDVVSYAFTDKEKFLKIKRKNKTDYLSTYDIKRITVE